jgi:hypothetical protein
METKHETPAHRLQQEPAEGSRETVNRELERQNRDKGSGEHGGNRGGSHDDSPKRSSQAAGKDPHRGKG